MAKQIVERNQAFVEKVLKENEALLLAYDQVKQELAETKFALNNSRKETLKSMEPKVAQLLESHKLEIAKQKEMLETKHEAEIAQIKAEFEKTRLSLISVNGETEEHCHQKLLKMKERALCREKEIKEAYNQRIELANQKIEEAKMQAKTEEEVSRTMWQKMVTEKIRAEFQEKAEADAKRLENRQQKMLMDVVAKVESDAHEESRGLKEKLDKETKDHRIVEQRLRKNIETLEQQIAEIKNGDKSNLQKLEDKVTFLSDRLSKCNCIKYEKEIELMRKQMISYEQQIAELQKQSRAINNEKEKEKYEIQQQNNGMRAQIADLESQIISLQQKHKSEMSLVAEKVKKTIQTKDERIQQLLDQFERITVKSSF